MAPNFDLERVRQEIVLANIQELLQKMTRRCFSDCVGVPGLELRSEERECLDNCMDRFMDAVQVVSRQYFRRRRRQQQQPLRPSRSTATAPGAGSSFSVPATASASASSSASSSASTSACKSSSSYVPLDKKGKSSPVPTSHSSE
ncbi:mitochondrial import inner membrane translocase subunit Tim13 [Drosophila bipectinata]|uniref:mitochondrial import inner membrane translocase subunit Tim13 n=1 Tax=Drosophila bipectinata TaxID=42026 RepID=UPI001C8A2BE7|nr:mitochondrial import inner membrane translocase subunit Tim13 [Drosophila bipectinata]